jgi:hypothetical protein
MANAQTFYEWFTSTSGIELDRRFPQPGSLDDEELSLIESNLRAMDEQHLAYAIVLLGHHCPDRLAPRLAEFLADPRIGVWTAAKRMQRLSESKGTGPADPPIGAADVPN